MIQERIRKLVVYVGDESEQFERRDIAKVEQVISKVFEGQQGPNVDVRIHFGTQNVENFIVKATSSIPNKQHIYATLVAYLAKKFEPVGQRLILKAFDQLQTALNDCSLIVCKNLLLFFAELMNLDLLNSFIFLSLLQDIVNELEKCGTPHKVFYLRLLARVLPACWSGLQIKLGQELRKMFDKIKKSVESLDHSSELTQQWKLMIELLTSGKIKDLSKIGTLRGEDLEDLPQYNPQIKLSFKDRKPAKQPFTASNQLFFEDEDKLYTQFSTSLEAYIHRDNISSIVQSFWPTKKVLCEKLILYILNSKNSFMSKFVIETLFREALLNQSTQNLIVYCSSLVQLSNEIDETLRNDLRRATEDTALAIYNKLDKYDINIGERLSEIVSFYIANFSSIWDWTKWAEGINKVVMKGVFLKLTFQKVIMLSEKALSKESTKDVSNFIPQSKTCLTVRESKQQVSYMSKMAEKLAEKADSDSVISSINGLNEYQMFLECLMTRMSNSNTHLNVLSERYKKVFAHFGQKFEKSFITSINSFWANSQFHKVQYLSLFIDKKIISFESFVEWLSMQAKVSEQTDKLLLRRLFNKVLERCNPNFDNKEMMHELEQSLAS